MNPENDQPIMDEFMSEAEPENIKGFYHLLDAAVGHKNIVNDILVSITKSNLSHVIQINVLRYTNRMRSELRDWNLCVATVKAHLRSHNTDEDLIKAMFMGLDYVI